VPAVFAELDESVLQWQPQYWYLRPPLECAEQFPRFPMRLSAVVRLAELHLAFQPGLQAVTAHLPSLDQRVSAHCRQEQQKQMHCSEKIARVVPRTSLPARVAPGLPHSLQGEAVGLVQAKLAGVSLSDNGD
jgi:hypothetical protein